MADVAVGNNASMPIDAITHSDKRVNIPTADAQDFVNSAARALIPLLYPRDPTLRPAARVEGQGRAGR